MKPYYEDDAVTIYHGDCRENLPAAAALVTDPPYGTGHYETDTEVLTSGLLRRWTTNYAVAAVFGWPEKLAALCAGSTPSEWVTWWPTNARQRGMNLHGLWREVECIAIFGKVDWAGLRQPYVQTTTAMPPDPGLLSVRGAKDERGARMGDVWRDESPNLNPNQRGRLHPNEKPVSLLRRLLIVMPEGTILDPFMGSGTTLRAAKDLGRKAIGIEIEERYCEIAAKRCAQEVLDMEAA